ncbi:MAG TPA: cysteine synthase family protein, partial [Anaerolineae bacterium]|nr:cysteine synthase family protein [Anaerolineae bacterium]
MILLNENLTGVSWGEKMNNCLLDLIGNTPVVEIKRLNKNKNVSIFAKLESANPGGSIKDRIAKHMIEKAEESGGLTREKIVLEATSGNTGIGLALVCSLKGYRLHIVMPETMSLERQQILTAFGAELLLTDGCKGMPGAIEMADQLSEDPKYFLINQFGNPSNPLAHYETTARELLAQVAPIDVFVAGIGTGGTLMGVGRRFKEESPHTKIIGVEPYPNSKIQGLRNLSEGYVPPIFDFNLIHDKVNISDDDAYDTAKDLARYEGLLCGISSGAVVAEALRRAERMKEGNIVVILADGGEKYLSTDLYTCSYHRTCDPKSTATCKA